MPILKAPHFNVISSTYAGQGKKSTGSFKLKDMFFNMDFMRKAGTSDRWMSSYRTLYYSDILSILGDILLTSG